MIIFGDNLRRSKTAVATYVIAALCVVLFLVSLDVRTFAFIPLEFSLHPVASAYRFVTAQFLHADVVHLFGNLIFLLAFGRSIENVIGGTKFAAACVGLGALSFLGSWLIGPDSKVPIIGASGSLAFLMGAYTIVFPRAKLRVIPLLRFPYLRAWFFAGLWIAFQIWEMITVGETAAGVAYATHLAGFVIGVASGATWKEFALDTDRLIAEVSQEDAS